MVTYVNQHLAHVLDCAAWVCGCDQPRLDFAFCVPLISRVVSGADDVDIAIAFAVGVARPPGLNRQRESQVHEEDQRIAGQHDEHLPERESGERPGGLTLLF